MVNGYGLVHHDDAQKGGQEQVGGLVLAAEAIIIIWGEEGKRLVILCTVWRCGPCANACSNAHRSDGTTLDHCVAFFFVAMSVGMEIESAGREMKASTIMWRRLQFMLPWVVAVISRSKD